MLYQGILFLTDHYLRAEHICVVTRREKKIDKTVNLCLLQ